MWVYEKKLLFPVNIRKSDLRVAKLLAAQYGGPASELAAAVTYLTQRYSMPDDRIKATLTDIGTEELAHWELLGAMLHQIMKCATPAAIRAAGLEGNFALHGCGIFPADPNGYNFTADYISVTGDPIADITFDMAAEQNSRATYEHILQLTDDPDIAAPIRFLRQREIVHFQRFGECLGILQHLKDPGCIL